MSRHQRECLCPTCKLVELTTEHYEEQLLKAGPRREKVSLAMILRLVEPVARETCRCLTAKDEDDCVDKTTDIMFALTSVYEQTLYMASQLYGDDVEAKQAFFDKVVDLAKGRWEIAREHFQDDAVSAKVTHQAPRGWKQ